MIKSFKYLVVLPVIITSFFATYILILQGTIIGQGGHDTFQYIEFSSLLFSQEPYVYFYRPVLYFLINVTNFFIGWEPYSLTVLLSICYLVSCIFFYQITYFFSKNLYLRLAISLFFISSAFLLKSVSSNYVFSLELMFVLGFVLFLFKSNHSKSIIYQILCAVMMYGSVHTHEDKFIFLLFCLFLYFFIDKKKSKNILILFILFSILTALYFGLIDVLNNLLRLTGAISDDWDGQRYNIITNFISIFDYTSISVLGNTITQVLYIFVIIKFLRHSFFDKFKFELKSIILISSTLYFLIMVILFNQIKLPRVLGPISILYLFLILYFCDQIINKSSFMLKTIFYSIIVMFVGFNLVNSYKYLNRNVSAYKFQEVYKTILSEEIKHKNKEIENLRILQLSSYENRYGMWGGLDDAYGLQSKVYFGKKAANTKSLLNRGKTKIQILNDYDSYDYLIFDKDKIGNKELKIFELELIKKYQKNSIKLNTESKNLFILKKI